MKNNQQIAAPFQSLLIAALALLIGIGGTGAALAQQPDLLWTQTRWRPDRATVLAVMQGESIDQESVYLWQLVNGRDPLVARVADTGLDQPSVRRPLEEAIRDYAVARLLAREAGTVPMTRVDLAGKASRVFAGDAAMVAYADLMIAPGIRVAPADVRHYYRTNPDLFVRPARVEVLELMISVNPAEGEAAFQSAINRANELRQRALTADGLLPVLEEHPELSTQSPIGRTRVLREVDRGVPAELWADLNALRVSQISQPIRTATAVMLYELVDRVPERRRSLEDVYPEIVRTLERKSYITQLEVALRNERSDARPLNQMQFYHLLEPEMTLLRVRGVSITRGEFDAMFPQYADGEDAERRRGRQRMANYIIRGETMAQALERERLLSAPLYQNALSVARTRVQADVRARALEAEFELSDDDLRAFVEANPERFAPDRTRFVWQLEFAPTAGPTMSMAERDRLMGEGAELIAEIAETAERLLDDRAGITGDVAFTSPQLVVNRLIPGDPDLPYTVTFRQFGELTPWDARERGIAFDGWEIGDFTEPLLQADGRVIAYYAADEVEQSAPSMSRQMNAAREVLLRDAGRYAARQRIEDLERTGSFSFRF